MALQDDRLQSAALPYLDRLTAGSDSANLLSNLVQRATVGDSLKTAQVALMVLGTLGNDSALPALKHAAARWSAGQLPPELELDLREALAKTALSNAIPPRTASADSTDLLAAFRACLVGGDALRGRHLFREHPPFNASAAIKWATTAARWGRNSTASVVAKVGNTCWKASCGPTGNSRRSSRWWC